MLSILPQYVPILIFIGIAALIGTALITASLIAERRAPYGEKLSAYECGFEPFSDSRRRFDVRYYLVAILFIIFDVEIALLFPWAVSLSRIGLGGFWAAVAFLAVLGIGFLYELRTGALNWE
jgi:NADH-quinone oxidoreductase subunit A